MDRLLEGHRRFKETYWQQHRELFDTLVTQGQSPRAMVIACSDSRADPQLVFDAGPGEIFVLRNVAALVPPYAPNADYHGTSAALEFAVRSLKVSHIIVMGHALCGGIQSLLKGALQAPSDFIGNWMRIAAQARDETLAACADHPERAQRACEHASIRVSLANLLTFPWIKERVEAGNLELHGWYFDLPTGDLERLDPPPLP